MSKNHSAVKNVCAGISTSPCWYVRNEYQIISNPNCMYALSLIVSSSRVLRFCDSCHFEGLRFYDVCSCCCGPYGFVTIGVLMNASKPCIGDLGEIMK